MMSGVIRKPVIGAVGCMLALLTVSNAHKAVSCSKCTAALHHGSRASLLQGVSRGGAGAAARHEQHYLHYLTALPDWLAGMQACLIQGLSCL